SAIAGSGWLAIGRVRDRAGSAASDVATQEPVQGADVELRSDVDRPKPLPGSTVERPALVVTVPHDRTPPRPAAAVESPPAQPGESTPPALADQIRIAKQQIDLKLYDQAIESLQKVAHGRQHQQAIDASFLIASVHDTRRDLA